MSRSNVVILVFFFFMENCSWCSQGLSLQCPDNERLALLDFTQGLKDASNRLSSWVGQDCCIWKGVRCSNRTGHVVKLDLRNPFPYNDDRYDAGYDRTYEKASLKFVKVNPSLLELRHLIHLDLSWNNFTGMQIPKFFGSFKELRYLNLSSAWFGGPIPHYLGNLSELRTLDLSTQALSFAYNVPDLIVDSFGWTSNLVSLHHLDMSGLNLTTMPAYSSQVITSLPSLLELRLSNCKIDNVPLFLSHGNLTSLANLDLSFNDFQGPIPTSLQNMTALRVLNLSHNQLSSNGLFLDELRFLYNLEILDLSYNQYTGKAIEHFGNSSSPSIVDNLETLYLSNNILDGHLPNWLYQLKNLKDLDLSTNSFHGMIPASFGKFPHMNKLDLSSNKLNGTIPTSLGNLSALEILILHHNELSDPIPISVGNLLGLEILDLSFNELGGQIPESLGNLSSLRELYLMVNLFNGSVPSSFGSLSNLNILDLDSNQLSGTIPASLGRLSMLRNLALGYNQLNGPIPTSLGSLSKLRELFLHQNRLTGPIPTSLGKLLALTSLSLFSNQLSGSIPTSLGRLSNLRGLNIGNNHLNGTVAQSLGQLSELTVLDISSNSLKGVLSEVHFVNLSKLEVLYLNMNPFSLQMRSGWSPPFQLKSINMGSCNLGPQFPEWLQTQTKFEDLDMSNASISDSIPNWFGNLSSQMSFLDLSGNRIYGTIPNIIKAKNFEVRLLFSSNNIIGPLLHFPSSVVLLDISDNNIAGPIPKNIGDRFPSMRNLFLSNNNFNDSIPISLCKMQNLHYVDLSKNYLSGDLPQCLWSLQLEVIDLASNNLSGTIRGSTGQLSMLRSLYLSNNNFHGEFPSALRNCTRLSILDLAENKLSGEIPPWIGEGLSTLRILRLRSNMFHGRIAPKLCHLYNLQIMDLAHNHITGRIPHCFGNLSAMVFGQTNFFWSGYSAEPSIYTDKLTMVIKGRELEYMRIVLHIAVNLDLSCNNFVGPIPEELANLTGLIGLNLSENHLTGNIPNNIGQMKSLQSLDLSLNNLSGRIPESIALLSFLSHLNLSYNKLSGRIPSGSQLRTFLDSSFKGDSELCGPPLEKKCLGDETSQAQTPAFVDNKRENEGQEFEISGLYIGMASGFILGLSGVCCVLLLKKTWRDAYFQFIEDMVDRLVVARVARLKDKLK